MKSIIFISFAFISFLFAQDLPKEIADIHNDLGTKTHVTTISSNKASIWTGEPILSKAVKIGKFSKVKIYPVWTDDKNYILAEYKKMYGWLGKFNFKEDNLPSFFHSKNSFDKYGNDSEKVKEMAMEDKKKANEAHRLEMLKENEEGRAKIRAERELRKAKIQKRINFENEQKAKKRNAFAKKYAERFLVNFDNKTIMIGFTREMVIDILGYPTKENKTTYTTHIDIQMVYRNANHKYQYVYTTNDIVTSFQE
jgi:hypothetical protein